MRHICKDCGIDLQKPDPIAWYGKNSMLYHARNCVPIEKQPEDNPIPVYEPKWEPYASEPIIPADIFMVNPDNPAPIKFKLMSDLFKPYHPDELVSVHPSVINKGVLYDKDVL